MSPDLILKRLFPAAKDRTVAIALLHEAITVAHSQRPTSWAVTLRDGYVRLNAGRVETIALFPDTIHLLVDRSLVPRHFGLDDAPPGLKSVPDSAPIDLTPSEARQAL